MVRASLFSAFVDHLFQRLRSFEFGCENLLEPFQLRIARLIFPERNHEVELGSVPVESSGQGVMLAVAPLNQDTRAGLWYKRSLPGTVLHDSLSRASYFVSKALQFAERC